MDISARFAHIAGQWVSTSCYTPEIKFFTAYTIDLLTKFYTVMYFRRSYCNSWLTNCNSKPLLKNLRFALWIFSIILNNYDGSCKHERKTLTKLFLDCIRLKIHPCGRESRSFDIPCYDWIDFVFNNFVEDETDRALWGPHKSLRRLFQSTNNLKI